MKKGEIISLAIFLISAFVITSLINGIADAEIPPPEDICPEGYVLDNSTCVRVITKTETTPPPIITEGCPDGEYVDDFGSCKPITQGGGKGGGGALYLSMIPSDTKGLSVLFAMLVFMVANWYIWGRKLFP